MNAHKHHDREPGPSHMSLLTSLRMYFVFDFWTAFIERKPFPYNLDIMGVYREIYVKLKC